MWIDRHLVAWLLVAPLWVVQGVPPSSASRTTSATSSQAAGGGAEPGPPAVLYHFGQRSHLVEDAKVDTIPQEAWDKYIMGGSTTFKSHPFRRGLYGTVHPAFADNFGEWFMAVHVKDECRKPEAVVTPSDLFKDARMVRWAANHSEISIAEFADRCFRTSSPLEAPSPRRILKVENLPDSGDRTAGYCEALLERFYREIDVKVILDEQWLEQEHIGINLVNRVSWYIRDRSCIEAIDGQESEIVQMLAAVPALWDDQELLRSNPDEMEPVQTSKAIERAQPVRMLLIGLAEFPHSASEEDLTKIRQAAEDGYARLAPLTEGAQALVPPIVDAFRRCRDRSRLDEFQRQIPRGDFDLALIPSILSHLTKNCSPS